MSEDIDFTEIDRLMSAMDDDVDLKKNIAADAASGESTKRKRRAAPKPEPKPLPIADPDAVTVKVGPRPTQHQPNPRTGRFMDMVRTPASTPTGPVSGPVAPPPIVVTKVVETQTVAIIDTEPEPELESALVPEPSSLRPEPELDLAVDDTSPETGFGLDTILMDVVDEPAMAADDTDYNSIDTPFLKNVQVEKRPLGGSGTTMSQRPEPTETPATKAKPERKSRRERKAERATERTMLPKKTKSSKAMKVILIVTGVLFLAVVGVAAYSSGVFEGIF